MGAKKYAEFEPGVLIINEQKDAIRIIEKAYTTRKILIHQSNINPDFFDLSSGLAGEVLQKLANYSVRAAFVVDAASIKSGRFKELMNETKDNGDYIFVASKEDAVAWLESLDD